MDPHYHGVFQTPEANLSAAMQWFSRQLQCMVQCEAFAGGPLFQGRYRAIPVENDGWAYHLSFYVHLNPLRIAGLGLDRRGRVLESKGWREPTPDQVTERLARLRWPLNRLTPGPLTIAIASWRCIVVYPGAVRKAHPRRIPMYPLTVW